MLSIKPESYDQESKAEAAEPDYPVPDTLGRKIKKMLKAAGALFDILDVLSSFFW